MCGRFTMTRRDPTELAAMLGVPESELGDYTPRFNIAPTQPYFVIKTRYESRQALPATWGLVNSWAKDASRAAMCINAKAETIDKLPRSARPSQSGAVSCPPTAFSTADQRPGASRFGFIWRTVPCSSSPDSSRPGRPNPASGGRRSRLSRRVANGTIEPIHNRMPVILDEAGAADWMNGREPDPLSLWATATSPPPRFTINGGALLKKVRRMTCQFNGVVLHPVGQGFCSKNGESY
jgi:putative SOS response-associated peptidase YedK